MTTLGGGGGIERILNRKRATSFIMCALSAEKAGNYSYSFYDRFTAGSDATAGASNGACDVMKPVT